MDKQEMVDMGRELAHNIMMGDEPLDPLNQDHFYGLVYEYARREVYFKTMKDEISRLQSVEYTYAKEIADLRSQVEALKKRVAEYTGKAEA